MRTTQRPSIKMVSMIVFAASLGVTGASLGASVPMHYGQKETPLDDWIAFFSHPTRGPLLVLETATGNCCGTNNTTPGMAAPLQVIIDGKKQSLVTPVVLTDRVLHLNSPAPLGLECESPTTASPGATNTMAVAVGGSVWPVSGDIEWQLANGATRLVINTVAGDLDCNTSTESDEVVPGQDFGSIFDPGG